MPIIFHCLCVSDVLFLFLPSPLAFGLFPLVLSTKLYIHYLALIWLLAKFWKIFSIRKTKTKKFTLTFSQHKILWIFYFALIINVFFAWQPLLLLFLCLSGLNFPKFMNFYIFDNAKQNEMDGVSPHQTRLKFGSSYG